MTHACIGIEGSISSIGSMGVIVAAAAAFQSRLLHIIPAIVGIGIGMLATIMVATPPK